MRAPLYFPLWVSWIRWPMQLRDTQQPTVSSHLIPPCLGFLTAKWKYIPAVQASWEAQKANIHNSDRQCSSGMKNAQERTSTRIQEDTGVSAGAEQTQPEGTRCRVMLKPGTGHLHPLLHLEGDFAPSGLWQWQLREIHPKGATKYLGFLHCGTLAPSPAGALRRSLCLPGEDINLSQTILAVRLISLQKGKRSKIIFHRTEQPWIHSTLPYSHNCMKLAILKILICHKTNKSTFFWFLSDFHTLQL